MRLINPRRRSVAIYRLENGRYAQPTILSIGGRTRLTAVPEAVVDWDRINERTFDPEA